MTRGSLTQPLLHAKIQPSQNRATDTEGRGSNDAPEPGSSLPSGGIFSRLWFLWISPFMQKGSICLQLQQKDLLNLDARIHPKACSEKLWRYWIQEVQEWPFNPSLLRIFVKSYWKPYLGLAVLKLGNDAVGLLAPLLLKLLVEWLSVSPGGTSGTKLSESGCHPQTSADTLNPEVEYLNDCNKQSPHNMASALLSGASSAGLWWQIFSPQSLNFGWAAGLALGLSCVLRAILNSHYNWGMGRLNCKLRAGLMCILYKKALLAGSSKCSIGMEPETLQRGQQGRMQRRIHFEEDTSSYAGSDEDIDLASETASAKKQAHKAGSEVVATLMSVDAGRVVNILGSFHELWGLPLQMLVALYLLYLQVRYAFVAGLVLSIVLIPVNKWIANRILAASTSMMAHKDERIRLTGEMLRGIRSVKMLAWEPAFVQKIQASRSSELHGLAVRKYLDALCVYLWASTGQLFSALTFGLLVLGGNSLSPGAAFASLALFQGLITPLNAFPWVVNGMVEAFVSMGRIRGYLLRSERRSEWAYQGGSNAGAEGGDPHVFSPVKQGKRMAAVVRWSSTLSSSPLQQPLLPSQDWMLNVGGDRVMEPLKPLLPMYPACAALISDMTCSWENTVRHEQHLCLSRVSLSIPRGQLTVIVGEVGAGKSSLLAALAGELQPQEGRCEVDLDVRIGYVPQSPWVMSGTLRDNILLGQPFERDMYCKVLWASALLPDLQLLSEGDKTSVGDRGSALSGGQRARLALARALYQRCSLYLLDDVLAAVDNSSAAHIIANVLAQAGNVASDTEGISAPSKTSSPAATMSTMVLVTKSERCIDEAGMVVHMQKGKVMFKGLPSQYRLWQQSLTPHQPPSLLLSASTRSSTATLAEVSPGPASIAGEAEEVHATAAAAAPLLAPPPASTGASHTSHTSHTSRTSIKSGPSASRLTNSSSSHLQGLPPQLPALSPGAKHRREGSTLSSTSNISTSPATIASNLILVSSNCPNQTAPVAGPSVVGAMHGSGFSNTHHGGSFSTTQPRRPPSFSKNAALAVATGSQSVVGGVPASSSSTPAAGAASSFTSSKGSPLLSWQPAPAHAGSGGCTAATSSHHARALSREEQQLLVALGSGHQVHQAELTSSSNKQQQQQSHEINEVDEEFGDLYPADGEHGTDDREGVSEDEEEREVGHVRWRVYSAYGKSVGVWTVALVLSTLLLMQFTKNANDVWISLWVASQAGGRHPSPNLKLLSIPYSDKWMHNGTTGVSDSPTWMHGTIDTAHLPWILSSSASGFHLTNSRIMSTSYRPMYATNVDSWGTTSVVPQTVRSSVSEAKLHPPPPPTPSSVDPPSSGTGMKPIVFLQGLLLLSILNSFFTLGRAFSFAFAGMEAARKTHDKLLKAVMAAPMAFFDAVPSGRIINRFSSDSAKVDDSLPFILNILLAQCASLLGLLTVMVASAPPLLLLLAPMAMAYRYLQHYYRQTSREVRRLDSISLSPVYGAFGEVVEAAPCLRAFKLQPEFEMRQMSLVALYQRAAISGVAAGVWLGVRLQLLAALLVTSVAVLAVGLHVITPPREGDLSASLAGLCLAYALPIVGVLDGLLTSSAETEQEMVAVERIMQYLHIQPQADVLTMPEGQAPASAAGSHGQLPALGSPASIIRSNRVTASSSSQQVPACSASAAPSGSSAAVLVASGTVVTAPTLPLIQLQDVYMRYSSGKPFALAGLSLTVALGERLGVVGRTGAGKSSLVAVLLRLVEIDSGSILLRGEDIRGMPLSRLRTSFGVVPQTPLLMSGSVRHNLDPLGRRSPGEIAEVLRSVCLWDHLAWTARRIMSLASSTGASNMPHQARTSDSTCLQPQYGQDLTQAPDLGASSVLRPYVDELKAKSEVGPAAHVRNNIFRVRGLASGGGVSGGFSDSSSLVSLRDLMAAQRGGEGSVRAGGEGGVKRLVDPSRGSFTGGAMSKIFHGTGRGILKGLIMGRGWFDSPCASPLEGSLSSFAGARMSGQGLDVWRSSFSTQEAGTAGTACTSAVDASGQGAVLASTASLPYTAPQVNMERLEEDSMLLKTVLNLRIGAGGGQDIGSSHHSSGVDSADCPTGVVGLSLGQRQLLCLARMLLQRRRIVLLDECTASVDSVTSSVMRSVLDCHLRGATVFQIAHDLDAVVGYDRVAVMVDGMVAEEGTPASLLVTPGSKFAELAASSARLADY